MLPATAHCCSLQVAAYRCVRPKSTSPGWEVKSQCPEINSHSEKAQLQPQQKPAALTSHRFPAGLAVFLELGVCINKSQLQTPHCSWMLQRVLTKFNAKIKFSKCKTSGAPQRSLFQTTASAPTTNPPLTVKQGPPRGRRSKLEMSQRHP